ncbi:DNA repair protein RadA [Timonella sp. A28]|uniref:DNA repair protein RadA n=1 Tax=Timonella sp. A28 TaxID=3442640 RepID=UPI003EB97E08
MATASKTSKARPSFRCSECGWTTAKWVGRCGECQEWGTVDEAGATPTGPKTTATKPTSNPARPIADISVDAARATPTGIPEFDRVLGGGLVPGAVVLLAGEPGVGKSTLLLDVAATAARGGRRVLYVTGEESAGQVRLRAERINALDPQLLLAAETDLGMLLGHVEAVSPDLLIVDSVQTIASSEVEGSPGGVGQVREVAAALIKCAKDRNLPVILVGHVTKDGSVAGPRTLEHLVDVVCQFEGDRHARLRMVRAAKNRFGPTDEVGCFELSEEGIIGLSDPSGLFLSHINMLVPGTCVTVTIEGRRPLALEVQSLVVPSSLANPRRTTSGVDSSRLAMILAVAHRHLGARLMDTDVYVSTIGGAKITEPAVDLAVLLALMSALEDKALPVGTIALGEVGLAGELRTVSGISRRLSEAARLGFTRAIVPASAHLEAPAGMQLLQAHTVFEAVQRAH